MPVSDNKKPTLMKKDKPVENKPVENKPVENKECFYKTSPKCVGGIFDPDTGVRFGPTPVKASANPKKGSFLQVQIAAKLLIVVK